MLRRTASYMKRHHLALVALFLALGGTSFAAGNALLPRNSVGTAQVTNGSLQPNDLSKNARTALKGNTGPRGPARTGCTGSDRSDGRDGSAGCAGSAGSAGDEALCRTGCRRHAYQEQWCDVGGQDRYGHLPNRLQHRHHQLRLPRDGGGGRWWGFRGLQPLYEPHQHDHGQRRDLRRK